MVGHLESSRPNLKDEICARSLTVGSFVMSRLPPRLNIIQNTKIPSFTNAYWHKALKSAQALGGQWVEYAGTEGSSNLPSRYTHAGIILIDREEMDRKLSAYDIAISAVAYQLGSAAMIGSSFKYPILGLEQEDDENYKVALGIGPGPLIAQAGIETPAGGRSRANSMLYIPLEKGVRKGPVLGMNEIPITIPQS